MLFYHYFAFKIFNESAITKGLGRCHDAPCIVNDGRPTVPYFFWLRGAIQKKSGVCGFCNVKAYEFQIQVFIHAEGHQVRPEHKPFYLGKLREGHLEI